MPLDVFVRLDNHCLKLVAFQHTHLQAQQNLFFAQRMVFAQRMKARCILDVHKMPKNIFEVVLRVSRRHS